MSVSLPDPEFVNEFTVNQCKLLLEADTPPLLMDCREIHEYEYCHIKGATLVPLSCFQGNAEAEITATDTPVIIYCHHGVRSLNATFYLREMGYSHIYSMQGGIDAWSLDIDQSIPRY